MANELQLQPPRTSNIFLRNIFRSKMQLFTCSTSWYIHAQVYTNKCHAKPSMTREDRIKYISSYLTRPYLIHCPNSNHRYFLIDIKKMLCKQSAFVVLSLLVFLNITMSCTASLIAVQKEASKPKLRFHMLVHCPSHLTVASSRDQEQQLFFSCLFLQTRKHSAANKYITPYSITTF